jgi:hypothetical protein
VPGVRHEADRGIDARVDDEWLDAVALQPLAQERVLVTLRVERADADDGCDQARSASDPMPRYLRRSSNGLSRITSEA